MKVRHYSFISEADQINLENPPENNGFEPLIKSKADIPLSNDQAEKLVTVAKIRQIEAKTKELEAKAKAVEAEAQMGGAEGGGIDPMTGMPMDPNAQMGGIDPMTGMPMGGGPGGIDPMTGMPMDPNSQMGGDPLQGLGDKSAPPDPMGGMGGGIDPMTGMPMGGGGGVYTAVGRAYKLKEIFDNLNKIRNYLRDSNNDELSKMYKDADKSFEMYKLVINNLKTYKEKVDDLIVMYYELIKIMLEKIKNTLNETQPLP